MLIQNLKKSFCGAKSIVICMLTKNNQLQKGTLHIILIGCKLNQILEDEVFSVSIWRIYNRVVFFSCNMPERRFP